MENLFSKINLDIKYAEPIYTSYKNPLSPSHFRYKLQVVKPSPDRSAFFKALNSFMLTLTPEERAMMPKRSSLVHGFNRSVQRTIQLHVFPYKYVSHSSKSSSKGFAMKHENAHSFRTIIIFYQVFAL